MNKLNKRYLAIGLFFAACSAFSILKMVRSGHTDHRSMTLALGFGFLGFLFFRNCWR